MPGVKCFVVQTQQQNKIMIFTEGSKKNKSNHNKTPQQNNNNNKTQEEKQNSHGIRKQGERSRICTEQGAKQH